MCVPSLNEVHESLFELLHTQVNIYGGGGMKEVNQYVPLIFVWEYNEIDKTYWGLK